MRRLGPRAIFKAYAVAWIFLIAVVLTELVYALLPAHDQAALVGWASTSVHNLHHHPIGSLLSSALIPQESASAWPLLIALSMFGANRALGNWRTALVCAAGQVIGTLVSEGIVAYQVGHGLLPPVDRYLIDIGPSYVVVSAIVIALLLGSWPARAAAAVDLVLLVAVGDIFGGLSQLNVAAVGHVTAMVVAAASAPPSWPGRGCRPRYAASRRRAPEDQLWQAGSGASAGRPSSRTTRRLRQAAQPRPAAYQQAPKDPTKNPTGQLVRSDSAIAAHTVTSANTTDRLMARYGLLVIDRAAAGGPIIRLKISRAPTTGSVMLVASATTTRKHISIRKLDTPRASASSGITEVSMSGRYKKIMAATDTAPSTATGSTSAVPTPNSSPNSSE